MSAFLGNHGGHKGVGRCPTPCKGRCPLTLPGSTAPWTPGRACGLPLFG